MKKIKKIAGPVMVTDQIGEDIRTIRKAEKITQAEVAARTGLDQARISKIESKTPEGLQVKTLQKILAGIGYGLALQPVADTVQVQNAKDQLIGVMRGTITINEIPSRDAKAARIQYDKPFEARPYVKIDCTYGDDLAVSIVDSDKTGFTVIVYNRKYDCQTCSLRWEAYEDESLS